MFGAMKQRNAMEEEAERQKRMMARRQTIANVSGSSFYISEGSNRANKHWQAARAIYEKRQEWAIRRKVRK